MLRAKKTKDVSKDTTILTLNKAEWDHFQKELSQPKPTTSELKNLMKMEGFSKHSNTNNDKKLVEWYCIPPHKEI